MGILVRYCGTCNHFHGRFTGYCTEPKCSCPEGASPSVANGARYD